MTGEATVAGLAERLERDGEFAAALEEDAFAALREAGFADLAEAAERERERFAQLVDDRPPDAGHGVRLELDLAVRVVALDRADQAE
ncbi:MAG TPA: hypothetical protein VNJ53_00005, partial [Gaiellaceae bacterium]|nr:hypothetical protein [Gaiellaceae bacterium]